MTETRVPVLIAGGGTVGLSTALFLAHQGVAALVVERQAAPSPHPRATGLGPRTVEFLRQVGLQEAVDAVAIDLSAGGVGKLSATTLAATDLSSLPRAAPARTDTGWADRVSPSAIRGTCPQNRLDSVLLPAARERGTTVRYATRPVSFDQDADGVTAILDSDSGHQVVRADYLIAADGVRSQVRAALGIGTSGPGGLGAPHVNILFRADPSPYTNGQAFVTCDITNPASPGMLATVDGHTEWIFHTSYNPEAGQTVGDFTPQRCRELIRAAAGVPDLDVEVVSTLPWRSRGLLAAASATGGCSWSVTRRTRSRPWARSASPPAWPTRQPGVEAGRGAHRPGRPRLARQLPGRTTPVAAFTLEQALLRMANPRLHWGDGPQAAAARAAAGIVNAPIVHMGYRHDSDAVIDPQPQLPSTEDIDLVTNGAPGSRLPHVWLERDGRPLSTLDLVRSGSPC